jgi:hypothetical protein
MAIRIDLKPLTHFFLIASLDINQQMSSVKASSLSLMILDIHYPSSETHHNFDLTWESATFKITSC